MGTLSLTDPTNGTTADASLIANNNSAIKTVVNGGLDNTNLAAGAAIAPSKVAVAYSAYTPTWTATGTAPAIGDAVVTARYQQIGKYVHAYGQIVFGASSTYGTGNYRFALPVTAVSGTFHIGTAFIFDASASAEDLVRIGLVSTTTFQLAYGATYLGASTAVGQLAPWTWTTSDQILWDIRYEAA